MSDHTHDQDDEEPPLVTQFVGRMAESWENFSPDREQLASAMLVFAVNTLIEAHDARHVAGLLVGIGAQLAHDESAGHA